MRAASVVATLALAACATEPQHPPPMVKDRACSVLDTYPGNVSAIKPDDARIWAAGTNAGISTLCKSASESSRGQ
jgi:hypothetical protein